MSRRAPVPDGVAAGLLGLTALAAPGVGAAAWLALLAVAAGAWLGARAARGSPAPRALRLVPLAIAAGVWSAVLALAGAGGWPGSSVAILALAAAAWGIGARAARFGPLPVASAALLSASALALAPAQVPVPGPEVRRAAAARVLLDLSPWTFVLESGGVDWMRHPAVYAPARTDWYSDARRPYPGLTNVVEGRGGPKALAAPLLLLVGCGLGLFARPPAWRSASTSARSPRS